MKLIPKVPVSLSDVLESIGFSTRRRIGLALGGGGARGFSHIGLMMAMEKYGLRPDVLSGVSAGSIAAVLYGAGLSPADMMQCFSEYDKFGDFTAWTIPKSGLFKLDKFAKLLESWLPVRYLEELEIPTYVCAADIDQGRSVGWSKGEIVPRVVASCSIPIVFQPVKIGNSFYVDGGVLRNLPAWAIRRNCDWLIGSNCSPLGRQFHFSEKTTLLEVALRSYALMSKANLLQDIQLCDLVVQTPTLAKYKTFEISEMKRIVRTGYDNACRAFEKSLNS